MNILSIRTFLLLLTLAASIPIVATVGYDFYSDRQQSIAHSRASLRMLASTMVSNTSTKIANAHHVLERLADRPLVKQIDPVNCDPALKDMLAMNPDYANIAYANLEGLVICSAAPLPDGKSVDISQRPWFQKSMGEKRFTVGHPVIGQIAGKWVSVLSAPIWNNRRELVGVIFLPLDLKTFDPNIPDQLLPAGSRYGFFAEDGTTIWRNLDPDGVIGTRPDAEAAQRIVEVRDGEFESLSVDGVVRFFSVVPMPEAGWIAFVGVPAATIYAEARQQAIIETTITLSAIALLILLAAAIARRIAKPIEELERAARAVRGGNVGARAAVGGPREIAAVALEFNTMAAAQQHGDELLRQSEGKLRAYLDNISDTIWLIGADLNMAYVSASVTRLLGLLPDDLIGKSSALVIHPDDMDVVADAQNYVMGHPGEPHTVQYRVRHGDGRWIHVESTGVNMLDNPAINGVLVTMRDISRRKQMEIDLQASEASMRAILDNSPYLVWLKDTEGRYITANAAHINYAHLKDHREIIGKTDLDLWPKELAEKYRADDAEVIATRRQKNVEEPSFDGDKIHWVETFKTPILDEDGNVLGTTGFARDITERKEAEAEIIEVRNQLQATLDAIPDMLFEMGLDGRYYNCRSPHPELLVVPAQTFIGKTVHDILPPEAANVVILALREAYEKGNSKGRQIKLPLPQGMSWFEFSITRKLGIAGQEPRFIVLSRDITERKRTEETIHNLAFYDALTQLPNRRLLNDRLEQALAASKRSGCYGALMFLDLDNFKPLNDAYGHGAGDLLLVEVAHRLTRCVREVDTVARFGGDEFVVMLSDQAEDKAGSAAQAALVAEKIRAALSEPYLLTFKHEGETEKTVGHHCAASIGVMVFNSEASAEDIIKWADVAMYQAKDSGRNQVQFYDERERKKQQ